MPSASIYPPAIKSPRVGTATTARPSHWKTLTEGALALVVVVTLLETMFAWGGIGEQEHLGIDPLLGYAPFPGKHVTWREEGFSRTIFNSLGMRDVERQLAKAPGTIRICVLGDSYVEALQVDRKQTFCNLLEVMLRKKLKPQQVEVLNFGVNSYNLGQNYLDLKNQVMKFHPDLVILAVRHDAAFQLTPNPAGGMLYARPTFFADAAGRLIQDNTIQEMWGKTTEARRMRATSWLRQHSRIWGVISIAAKSLTTWYRKLPSGNLLAIFSTPNASPSLAAFGSTNPTSSPTGSASPSSSENNDRATTYLWKVADALIGAMKRECDSHRCRLMVLRLAGCHGYNNQLESRLLEKSCRVHNLQCLNVSDAFGQAAHTGGDLFYIWHLTFRGHQLLATKLYQFLLQERLLVPGPNAIH